MKKEKNGQGNSSSCPPPKNTTNTDQKPDSLRRYYDQQLDSLDQTVLQAADLCLEMAKLTTQSIQNGIDPLKTDLLHLRKRVATLVHETDRLSVLLILKQQPIAYDLQRITHDTRLSLELDRIAHLYEDLAVPLQSVFDGKSQSDLLSLAEACQIQLQKTVAALKTDSGIYASDAILMDDDIDSQFEALQERLTKDLPFQSVNILMAAKYFERIADHSVVICSLLLHS